MFNDLRDFITHLEGSGELIRVKEELSTRYEIPAAMKYVEITQRPGVSCLEFCLLAHWCHSCFDKSSES